jgi:hypothetical protein
VEIHPSHGAAHSWKDLLIQLATITAGILIALSFEGVREWRHDRALVAEARRNLQREIADNKKELDNELVAVATRTGKIDTALRFAAELLKAKKTDIHRLELELSFPTLGAAAWQTAERTGAFAHMEYDEVQKYASAYTIQELLTGQHRRALEAIAGAIGILTASEDGDPTQAPAAELERFRQRVVELRSILLIEEQIARQTSKVYKTALE